MQSRVKNGNNSKLIQPLGFMQFIEHYRKRMGLTWRDFAKRILGSETADHQLIWYYVKRGKKYAEPMQFLCIARQCTGKDWAWFGTRLDKELLLTDHYSEQNLMKFICQLRQASGDSWTAFGARLDNEFLPSAP